MSLSMSKVKKTFKKKPNLIKMAHLALIIGTIEVILIMNIEQVVLALHADLLLPIEVHIAAASYNHIKQSCASLLWLLLTYHGPHTTNTTAAAATAYIGYTYAALHELCQHLLQ